MAGSYPHWEFHVRRYMRTLRQPFCRRHWDQTVWRTTVGRTLYGSSMCSTTLARLARIYRAIEELESRSGQGTGESAGTSGDAGGAVGAADSPAGTEGLGAADSGPGADEACADIPMGTPTADGEAAGDEVSRVADDDVAHRLAEIWAMIADADPELAKRLPRYLGPNQ